MTQQDPISYLRNAVANERVTADNTFAHDRDETKHAHTLDWLRFFDQQVDAAARMIHDEVARQVSAQLAELQRNGYRR